MTQSSASTTIERRQVSTAAAVAPKRYKARAAVAVGAYIPDLTQKAFEKFGFHTAALVTDWADIAGDELAAFTSPDRLTWPRGVQADLTGDEADCRTTAHGATLVLRVAGARALEIQHRKHQVLERINAYFGYRAVSDLKILQAPVTARFQPKAVGASPRQALSQPAPAGRIPRMPEARMAPPSRGARSGAAAETPAKKSGIGGADVTAQLDGALTRLAAGVARRFPGA